MAVKIRPPRPSRERANPFNTKKELLTDPVFLLGNGTSRNAFELERLREHGTIIGCNAIYRDFEPDILVAIDAKILSELVKAKYCDTHTCIIPNNRTVAIKSARRFKTEQYNTSGCFAMKMVSQLMKPSKCYMLGMDCYPGNVYDGSANYQPNTLQNFSGIAQYYLKALRGIGETIFVNVNVKDSWPKEAHETGKYTFITYEEFEEVLNEKETTG